MIGIRTFYKVLANVSFISNTTLAPIGLSSKIAANEKQNFKCWIFFSEAGAGDIQFEVTVPAGGVLYNVTSLIYDIGGGIINYEAINSEAPISASLAAGAGLYFAEISGYIENGVTPGSIDILAAQNVSDAGATIINAGASMEVIKT